MCTEHTHIWVMTLRPTDKMMHTVHRPLFLQLLLTTLDLSLLSLFKQKVSLLPFQSLSNEGLYSFVAAARATKHLVLDISICWSIWCVIIQSITSNQVLSILGKSRTLTAMIYTLRTLLYAAQSIVWASKLMWSWFQTPIWARGAAAKKIFINLSLKPAWIVIFVPCRARDERKAER